MALSGLLGVGACSFVVVQQPFEPLPIRAKRPAPPPPRVVLTPSSIQIGEKIQFAFDSAEILPASHGLLGEVATLLRENAQIEVLQIEGHTDSTGKPDYNRELSRKRAESVRAFLVKAGIEGRRLAAKGFGPDRPIAENETEAGKERNRRVEFNIVKQGPKKTLVQDE
jgi:OOP family OmpA-OmpF porin